MHRGIVSGIRDFGLLNAFKHHVIERVNRVTFFKVIRLMMIDQPVAQWSVLESKYISRFLEPDEMRAFARRAEFDLSGDFVQTAVNKADRCYAIFEGPLLASYGWYSRQATRLTPDLQLTCARDYIYMYHGYTHPEYRGRRLHAIRATRGLDEYMRQGAKGLVFYVEENNFRSLRSVARLNSLHFGWVFAIKLFGKMRIYHSPGCAKYGVRVTSTGMT